MIRRPARSTLFPCTARFRSGAGVTVRSMTVVSPTQLSVALAIEATAAMGPRDVAVSNPDGQSVVLTGGFTVTPPPPTLGLAFLGRSEERRVGKECRSRWSPYH